MVKFAPSESGFQMAFGFRDKHLPPEIGTFTYKYREKSRVKDPESVTGLKTYDTQEVEVPFHNCTEKEQNWE
jgi:hypothetical protein